MPPEESSQPTIDLGELSITMWTDWSVRSFEASMDNLSEKKLKRCCDEESMLARREEILDTATELFAEQGFSDAVTQVLADRLQIGKGTLYRHFPSKRELFLAAADRVMVKLNERIESSIVGITDGLERVAK